MATLMEQYNKLIQEELMQTKEGLKFLVYKRDHGHQLSDMTTQILAIMSDNGMGTEESLGYLQYLKSKINGNSSLRFQK